ncbi:uncharacterized protein LOC135193559 [Vanessa tameamea]|uniref:Uncharacterized protein LOC135193559 n=1 Tax=Vanessa tameamea TaxID=334116 RepID=A0ABM4AMU5_VANTA
MDCTHGVRSCPTFCVLKTVVVAVGAISMLFFPLGDPYEVCRSTNTALKQNVPMVCLCDFYIEAVKFFTKTKEVTEVMVRKTFVLLYEAKLKFYNILNNLDGGDLYQSICCKDSEIGPGEDGRTRPICKCSRKCFKKNTV